jgi:hypothetical protein
MNRLSNRVRKWRRLYDRGESLRMGIKFRPSRSRGVVVMKSTIPPEALAKFRAQWEAMIRGPNARMVTIVPVSEALASVDAPTYGKPTHDERGDG